jgi:hypothetical protein
MQLPPDFQTRLILGSSTVPLKLAPLSLQTPLSNALTLILPHVLALGFRETLNVVRSLTFNWLVTDLCEFPGSSRLQCTIPAPIHLCFDRTSPHHSVDAGRFQKKQWELLQSDFHLRPRARYLSH